MTARLGLGTYRCLDVGGAAAMAALRGADWVDTAPNYEHGLAETSLMPVLTTHSGLSLSTKVGFVPRRLRGLAVRAGAIKSVEADSGHCLSPKYVSWQVARSRKNLGRTPDVVFLHNPDHHCTPEQLQERLYIAFTALEDACAQRIIHGYGVATWTGFSSGLLSVPTLLELATKAGGPQNHLRAIQLPLSLVKLSAIADALDGRGVLAEAAAAELAVFASAPLHGGEVPKLITTELAELIRPGSTPAQAALAVVASTPGVKRVLLSTDRTEHWSQAMATVGQPPVTEAVLRKVVDVLGT